jgi:ATP-dependent HslUV protease subunit HslV
MYMINKNKGLFKNYCKKCANDNTFHGTTVLAVRRLDKVVMVADGQMTLGHTRFKNDTKKLRRLNENIIAGFAGSVADAQSLLENLESEIEAYPQDMLRACLNLAKTWRTNRSFRRLHASLIVCDSKSMLNLDGEGNVIEIKDGVCGIGSGGIYAQSAARALYDIDGLTTDDVALRAMKIAADLCIYTNSNFTIETIDIKH